MQTCKIQDCVFDNTTLNWYLICYRFRHSLTTFGDKFSQSEVDNAYAEFQIADGYIDAVHLKSLMVSKKEEGEEGA